MRSAARFETNWTDVDRLGWIDASQGLCPQRAYCCSVWCAIDSCSLTMLASNARQPVATGSFELRVLLGEGEEWQTT